MIKVSLTCINFNLWKGLHQIRVKTTYHKYAANNSNRAKVYSHLFVASVFNRRSETERNKILSSLSRSFPAYKGSAAFPFSTRTVLPVNRYPLTRIYIYIYNSRNVTKYVEFSSSDVSGLQPRRE